MRNRSQTLFDLLGGQPVVPVLTIERLADAVPLAKALVAGGLRAIEITMRTADALDAVRLCAAEVPGVVVGAGTVLSARDYNQAVAAGARFVVSPGTTQELLDAAASSRVPFLPGAVTPSEIMAVQEEGYSLVKFFPAEQAGGADFLKSLAAPLPNVHFCPTGGITAEIAPDYLAAGNVACVGGSWMAPRDAVRAGDWETVEDLARRASLIGKR